MLPPLVRFALATASALCCFVAARPARADGDASPVAIESDEEALEVFTMTDQVTMQPVRVGRYGSQMVRAPVYATVCTRTPCETELMAGTYHLALSRPGGSLVDVDETLEVNGPVNLHVHLTDRSWWRAAGVLTAIIVPLASVPLFLMKQSSCIGGSPAAPASTQPVYGTTNSGTVIVGTVSSPGSPAVPCTEASVVNPVGVGLGIGVIAVGLIASFAMLAQHDSASVSVQTLTLGAMPGARESSAAGAVPNGLQLTVRF